MRALALFRAVRAGTQRLGRAHPLPRSRAPSRSGSLADTVKTVRLPRRGPGIGPELSPQQELACALRILAREGWRENLSGHITVATDDGGMWCTPWGLGWGEVRASDILRLDAAGEIVEGEWDVTPAVFLHTELHRARADARVIVHNHPYWATLLSTLGEAPGLVHQN